MKDFDDFRHYLNSEPVARKLSQSAISQIPALSNEIGINLNVRETRMTSLICQASALATLELLAHYNEWLQQNSE
jgi:hypothetical protein